MAKKEKEEQAAKKNVKESGTKQVQEASQKGEASLKSTLNELKQKQQQEQDTKNQES